MSDPLFWLGASLGLVAFSLAIVLATLIPAVRELQRAARSVEVLAETLSRDLPPTLDALRLTGIELGELSEDANSSLERARQTLTQIDRVSSAARSQSHNARVTTRSLWVGAKAAWRTWKNSGDRDGAPPAAPLDGKGDRPDSTIRNGNAPSAESSAGVKPAEAVTEE